MSSPLDSVPLWGILGVTFALGLAALEGGYRYGAWRHTRVTEEKVPPVAAMVASLLGLLAFMLAFTFSLAASRFDARRQAVLNEANAIGTTYLRARLLPEPHQSKIAAILRDYVKLRSRRMQPAEIEELLKTSEELHNQIWSEAVAVAEQDRTSIMTGLFLQSLNESIDLHATRVYFGLRSRIPLSIWLALLILLALGLGSVGYQAGLSATRRSPEMPVLAFAFSIVLFLIVELDRGHEGFLQISQQPMIDLYNSMESSLPHVP